MKKKLAAELERIAQQILQHKDVAELSQLQKEARLLYEKLTILIHLESETTAPTQAHTPSTISETTPEISTEEVIPQPIPQSETSKPELIIEEINAKISGDLFVPASPSTENPGLFASPSFEKNDMGEIGNIPPIPSSKETLNTIEEKPKSLNDQLKKGIQIGLNDRIAFIKHLFDNNPSDYNRVLSQLNTMHTTEEVEQFIEHMIKPDYQGWHGKEEYADRFVSLVMNKFNS